MPYPYIPPNELGMHADEEYIFRRVLFPTDLQSAIRFRTSLAAVHCTHYGFPAFSRESAAGKLAVIARDASFAIYWLHREFRWLLVMPFNEPVSDQFLFNDLRYVLHHIIYMYLKEGKTV